MPRFQLRLIDTQYEGPADEDFDVLMNLDYDPTDSTIVVAGFSADEVANAMLDAVGEGIYRAFVRNGGPLR